jgi:hypothetical protein
VEAKLGVNSVVNMVDETKLEESVDEEGAPLGVVGLVEIQFHGNMGLHVDEIDKCSSDGHRWSIGKVIGEVRGGAADGGGRGHHGREERTLREKRVGAQGVDCG